MGYKTELVQFITHQNIQLEGAWFGKPKNRTAIIFIHGLAGSFFSRIEIISSLAKKNVSVLSFNNRGSGKVNGVKKIDVTQSKGYRRIMAGEAHEVFTECVDDIQGAVDLCKKRGAKKIFLIGHSTGCQKSIYYASRKSNQKNIAGIVLLCPVSDYAFAVKNYPVAMKRAIVVARKLVARGRSHEMLPLSVWPHVHDAQRFLSLHTPQSAEEVFTYATKKKPVALQKVKIPILAVIAEKDEFHDRPAAELADWYRRHMGKNQYVTVIPGSDHAFRGKEAQVVRVITKFVQ